MLRAVSAIYLESQALDLFLTARKDARTLLRAGTSTYSTAAPASPTVMSSEGVSARGLPPDSAPESPPPPPPPLPPLPPPPRRSWPVAAAALAITASLGGVYFFRKLSDEEKKIPGGGADGADGSGGAGGAVGAGGAAPAEEPPYPALGSEFPAHVQYLLVGAGTASFAAMRAIRSARPDARVLLVGDEPALPYMRPPLSKELWREPDLAERARRDLDALTFRQWNGRRRTVTYEPPAFYVPVSSLGEGGAGGGGAGVARGWRVVRLDVARHEAELRAPGVEPVVVRYDKCLVATGVRARRAAPLHEAAAAGRALTLRGVRDAARLAAQLERPDVTHVAVLGGGFLASELSAALAERLRGTGRRVTQVFREAAPLAGVLPAYLAEEAARRLREAGVHLVPGAEVLAGAVQGAEEPGAVRLQLASGGALDASLVVECVGSEVDEELARASHLETHPELGGLLVNAELQARSDVYAAGDVACFYDVSLGRRRVEHHDHAVVSGRLAGENMAALDTPKHYTHQSMFWSDLGPQLGYEAIGIVDSRLPTVGVFCADAVSDARLDLELEAGSTREAREAHEAPAEARRYERGVVFYVRERRVVGVLLWNLFNRMHVARQVLAQAEFDDLFEVAKLFSLHEDD